eukprot:m.55745 g.55745  ORF g.55745 m.55745 type:complete len:451 (-) comp22125_c0_seq3:163-1515(-)
MRICHVCDFFHPNSGGVENHIYAVTSCLVLAGHKVVVVTHSYGDRVGVRYITPGIKVYHLPFKVIYNQAILPTALVSAPLVRHILIREQIQVVHGHAAFSTLANEALNLAAALGIPSIFTDHSLFGFSDMSAIITNKLLKYDLKCVSHVICVSHTGRENTVLRSRVPLDQVSVIPNAIDNVTFKPPAAPLPNSACDKIYIVVVSRLVYRKGMDLLARLIPLVCEKHPNVNFIVGGDGPKRIDIEEVREQYHIQHRVEMLGNVPHARVTAVLQQGHIFLNCSLTEAFCIAILEAASCGLIVVSTNVGGVPEVLPHDITVLAEPNVTSILVAIDEAITRVPSQNPHLQHERVRHMYNWQDVAVKTVGIYHRAMAQPPIEFADRLERIFAIGYFAGFIFVCMSTALQILLHFCEAIVPANTIEPAIHWPSVQQQEEHIPPNLRQQKPMCYLPC